MLQFVSKIVLKYIRGGIPEGDPKGDDPATRQCDPLWETKGMTIGENKGGDQKVAHDVLKNRI